MDSSGFRSWTWSSIRRYQYIENIENYHEAIQPEKPLSRFHQLPQPPADFTGRETLIAELLEDFKKSKSATISGLTGMGGIGKTALGLKVAHQIADDYPDAQIFLDLKGTTEPLSCVSVRSAREESSAFL